MTTLTQPKSQPRTNIERRADDPAPAIAPEGVPIVAIFVIVAILASVPAHIFLGPWAYLVSVPAAVLCLWCLWFFRDPQRSVPVGDGIVVCPADGRVVAVDDVAGPEELGVEPGLRICIFMNVFNVHVNRSPLPGVVRAIHYRPGKFFNASFDKASVHNERTGMVVELDDGRRIGVVQIAGLVARRIVCRVKEGARLNAGERYGLIRFGSRVDVYLPTGAESRVAIGDITKAGETVLAVLPPA